MKRQLSEDETAENTETPNNKTIRTYIYASDIDIEEHHPIKIEDEIDLSTTGMQLQNNSEQREMETLKKAQYIYFRTVSYYRIQTNLLDWFRLVYGSVGLSNMHSALDFCPRLARKDSNVPTLYSKVTNNHGALITM